MLKNLFKLLKMCYNAKGSYKLLMAILLTELSMVALTVGLNQFRRMFMDSFQQHNFQHFLEAIAFFSAMAAAWVLSKGYNSYLKEAYRSFGVRLCI